jgi:hypothetical protein
MPSASQLAAVLAVSLTAGAASADPEQPSVSAASVSAAPRDAANTVYVDLFGKGGLWGLGYDHQLGARFVIGGLASFYVLGGDRFTTIAPYVGAYLLGDARHRWFAHVGPELSRHTVPSPVPEWSGMSTNALTGEVSSGYEHRGARVIVRAYAMLDVGEHVTPGVGGSLGWRF